MAKKNYLENELFIKELRLSREQDKLTDKAIEYLYTLVEHLQRSYTYVDEADRYDVRQIVMLKMVEGAKWKKFDETKSDNPFSFFTTTINRDMMGGFNKLYDNVRKNSVSIDNIYKDRNV